jgi:hypothetical protein
MTKTERDAMKDALKLARGLFGWRATVRRLPAPDDPSARICQVGTMKRGPAWTELAPNSHRVGGVDVLGEGPDWETAISQAASRLLANGSTLNVSVGLADAQKLRGASVPAEALR